MIGLLGKAPSAGPASDGRRRLAPLRRLGLRIPDEILNLLRFGRGVDNRLYKATGFDYGYTSREAVLDLAEHVRLEPVLRGHEQRYRYEREVEEFLRWSPHVRRAPRGRGRRHRSRAARNLKGGLQRRGGFLQSAGRPSTDQAVGRKLQIAVAAVIVLMLGAAVGAYAWTTRARTRSPRGSRSAASTSAA